MPVKSIAKFFIVFVLVFTAFLLIGYKFQNVYTSCYCASMQVIDKLFTSGKIIVLIRNSGEKENDVQVVAYNRSNVRENGVVTAVQVKYSSRHLGYLPTAFLLSLVISTLQPWKKKVLMLLYALIAIHLYILFKSIVVILYFQIQNEQVIGYSLLPFWRSFWISWYDLLISKVYPDFFLGILFWILLIPGKSSLIKDFLRTKQIQQE
jgi:hypothetical protein